MNIIKILLLWPLSLIYWLAVEFRNFLYGRGLKKTTRAGIPVISVGNLVAGGTGKTPCAIMLAELLGELGYRPAIVSRGYGRRPTAAEPILVSDGDKIFCSPDDSGDEPYLMAKKLLGRKVLIIVSGDRLAGARLAERSGADVVILDDGFQHRRLWRDLNILLLDCQRPFDNGWLLPAGLLREPKSALKRAELVILTRCEAGRAPDPKPYLKSSLPALAAAHVPGPIWRLNSWRCGGAGVTPGSIDRPVMLFSGLARPESFERSVTQLGLRMAGHLKFPDHHRYHKADLLKIEKAGLATGRLLTTEKDAVRLPEDWHPEPEIYVLGVSMQMISRDQTSALKDIIRKRMVRHDPG